MFKRLAAVALVVMCLTGCHNTTKNFGGSMEIELPANQKLEEITWKDDDSLWYLTRPMREGEDAEVHTFQQDSEWGVFEGTVTIIERKE